MQNLTKENKEDIELFNKLEMDQYINHPDSKTGFKEEKEFINRLQIENDLEIRKEVIWKTFNHINNSNDSIIIADKNDDNFTDKDKEKYWEKSAFDTFPVIENVSTGIHSSYVIKIIRQENNVQENDGIHEVTSLPICSVIPNNIRYHHKNNAQYYHYHHYYLDNNVIGYVFVMIGNISIDHNNNNNIDNFGHNIPLNNDGTLIIILFICYCFSFPHKNNFPF